MNYYIDILMLDVFEGFVEVEVIFVIDVVWLSYCNVCGYCSVDWISSCELESWIFDGCK